MIGNLEVYFSRWGWYHRPLMGRIRTSGKRYIFVFCTLHLWIFLRAFNASSHIFTVLFPYLIYPLRWVLLTELVWAVLRNIFSYIGLTGSIFMTFAISIERFLGICYPLKVTTRSFLSNHKWIDFVKICSVPSSHPEVLVLHPPCCPGINHHQHPEVAGGGYCMGRWGSYL